VYYSGIIASAFACNLQPAALLWLEKRFAFRIYRSLSKVTVKIESAGKKRDLFVPARWNDLLSPPQPIIEE